MGLEAAKETGYLTPVMSRREEEGEERKSGYGERQVNRTKETSRGDKKKKKDRDKIQEG